MSFLRFCQGRPTDVGSSKNKNYSFFIFRKNSKTVYYGGREVQNSFERKKSLSSTKKVFRAQKNSVERREMQRPGASKRIEI